MREQKSSRKKKVSTIDPFCTVSSRKQLEKKKAYQLNDPPDKVDALDQPVSRRMRDLYRVLEPMKRQAAGKKSAKRQEKELKRKREEEEEQEPVSRRARKRKKAVIEQHEQHKVKPQSSSDRDEKLTRKPGESDKKFLRRVTHQTKKDVREQMDDINILKKHDDGGIQALLGEKKKKPSEKSKERLKKLHDRKDRKKFEKNLDNLEKQFFRDKVAFGEVAMRPPELSFQPRKSLPSNTAGQRNLLLTSIMNTKKSSTSTTSSQAAKGTAQKSKSKGLGMKKRKDMNDAEKRQFDARRDDAILAYRKLKAKALADRTMKL